MHHPLPALALLALIAGASACGKLKVVPVPEPGDEPSEAEPAIARPAPHTTGSAWASQLALDACRAQVARRWRLPETRVRTSSRAHDSSDRTDLVNWDIESGAAGYCRVDPRGTVLNVETERAPQPRPDVAREPPPEPRNDPPARPPDPADVGAPDDDEPPRVAREQLDACRGAVVREIGARPDEVGLSAGTPDEHGTVLIDWSLGSGREGTCVVDSSATVVQFRR